jgi:hypothetical protein
MGKWQFTQPACMSRHALTGNTFKSRVTVTDRATYSIEYSDDLQTWLPLMTNSAVQFDLTNAVSPSVKQRVFRVKGIP